MTVPNYCRPCGENLLPQDVECPFCGQNTTPVDELADAIRIEAGTGGTVKHGPTRSARAGAEGIAQDIGGPSQ